MCFVVCALACTVRACTCVAAHISGGSPFIILIVDCSPRYAFASALAACPACPHLLHPCPMVVAALAAASSALVPRDMGA